MSNVLVKWSTNWADEMDIEGFVIVSKNFSEKMKEYAKTMNRFDICIGTNEEIEYSNGNEFLTDLEFYDLTDEQNLALLQTTGGEFGHTEFMYKFEELEEDNEYNEDVQEI